MRQHAWNGKGGMPADDGAPSSEAMASAGASTRAPRVPLIAGAHMPAFWCTADGRAGYSSSETVQPTDEQPTLST